MSKRVIFDVSLPITESMVVWKGDTPVRIAHTSHLSKGDHCTLSRLSLGAHTGTHMDAPAHFIPGGAGIETLDLDALIGPAAVVDARGVKTLSGETLRTLAIPPGCDRILFRTSNSDRWARGEKEFAENYVGVTETGARWLVSRGVRLVGVDYLSVADFRETGPTHRILLEAGTALLEGLNLTGIEPGVCTLVCLPLKIVGGDGAPTRAVLIRGE